MTSHVLNLALWSRNSTYTVDESRGANVALPRNFDATAVSVPASSFVFAFLGHGF